jgi:hypothetical protein
MNCNEVERLLSAYQDEELSSERREPIGRHLGSCPSCASQAARLAKTRDWYQVGEVEAPPSILQTARSRKRSPSFRVLVPAFSLLTLLLIFGLAARPTGAEATFARMMAASSQVRTLHMKTWAVNRETGAVERGDSWYAYGCMRREGLRGMRAIRGLCGRLDYDSVAGVFEEPDVDERVPRLASAFVGEMLRSTYLGRANRVTQTEGEWNGRSVTVLTIEEDHSIALFFVDPETDLPLYHEAYGWRDGVWRKGSWAEFTFDVPLAEEMFTRESLRRRYAP